MRLLFLDIDGVLNSLAWYNRHGDSAPWPHLDPETIPRLNRLVDESGAKVVLSSTWRKFGLSTVAGYLRDAGYTGKFYSATPPKRPLYPNRGEEIQLWLDAYKRPVESFVILDDGDDLVHLTPRLVRTDWRIGLADADVERALALFLDPIGDLSLCR